METGSGTVVARISNPRRIYTVDGTARVLNGALMANRDRPLSPHLQVYKPQLTSVLSITHRATGIFLTVGTLLLVYWISAIASGPQTYEPARELFGSLIGRLFLLGWSYALFYHLCNGIRHLCWDMGLGFDIKTVYITGRVVIIASLVLTLIAWLVGYAMLEDGL